MFVIKLIALIATMVAVADSQEAKGTNTPVEVVLDAFSGRENPKWSLDEEQKKGFGDKFDELMRRDSIVPIHDGLGYRGPAVILAALDEVAPGRAFGATLDLGCGTGLMAQALVGRAGPIDGIDLSPGMIAQASREVVHVCAVAHAVANRAFGPSHSLGMTIRKVESSRFSRNLVLMTKEQREKVRGDEER